MAVSLAACVANKVNSQLPIVHIVSLLRWNTAAKRALVVDDLLDVTKGVLC
jgi:hypothetical protein